MRSPRSGYRGKTGIGDQVKGQDGILLIRVADPTGRFPAVDLVNSGTVRSELLVGEAGAEAIARARAEAMEEAAARGH